MDLGANWKKKMLVSALRKTIQSPNNVFLFQYYPTVISLLAASNNHIFDQLAEKKQTFFRQFTFLPWRVMGLWMNNAFSHPLYFGLAEKKVSWKKSLAFFNNAKRTIHPTPVSRWQKSRFHEQAIKFKHKKGQNMTIEFFVM